MRIIFALCLTFVSVAAFGGRTGAGDFPSQAEIGNLRRTIQTKLDSDPGYPGYFIRLAWHCAGTYRVSDGRGGCDGARIRFSPEKDWADNNNLDKAIVILQEIKDQTKLSWGDLIVLTGNTAIESKGAGPEIKFCGGRVDEPDGSDSIAIDEDIQMIYVDAGKASAQDIREAFEIMDMNDRETIALIGGGHAFGRCHRGTSGFEGPWTTTPTTYSNQYYSNLLNLQWEKQDLGDGLHQFHNAGAGLMMLQADISLRSDESYLAILDEYLANPDVSKDEFGKAWYKLVTRDLGDKPCAGEEPVPSIPDVDFTAVKQAVLDILPNSEADAGNYGPFLVRLAWHCAGTYRDTDKRGGCNGARIRMEPESSWGENAHLEDALKLLEPIKEKFGAELTWADLIVIAGTSALESMGANPMPFCPGRIDEENGDKSRYLDPAIYINAEEGTADQYKNSMEIMGFSVQEMTVLNGGGHAIGRCHVGTSGFNGPWTSTPSTLDNSFFTTLLENNWSPESVEGSGRVQNTNGKGQIMLNTDLLMRDDPEFRYWTDIYANDNTLFQKDFAAAWTKLMNGGRFGNVCFTTSLYL